MDDPKNMAEPADKTLHPNYRKSIAVKTCSLVAEEEDQRLSMALSPLPSVVGEEEGDTLGPLPGDTTGARGGANKFKRVESKRAAWRGKSYKAASNLVTPATKYAESVAGNVADPGITPRVSRKSVAVQVAEGCFVGMPMDMGIHYLAKFVVEHRKIVIAVYGFIVLLFFGFACTLQFADKPPSLVPAGSNEDYAAVLEGVFTDFSGTSGTTVSFAAIDSTYEAALATHKGSCDEPMQASAFKCKPGLVVNTTKFVCAAAACTEDECCTASCGLAASDLCSARGQTFVAGYNTTLCADASGCLASECCRDITTCASINQDMCTPNPPLKAKSNPASILCETRTCTKADCCDSDYSCHKFRASVGAAAVATRCPAGTHFTDDRTTVAKDATYKECCVANPKCGAADYDYQAKCEADGKVLIAGSENKVCAGKECKVSDCCSVKTCSAYPQASCTLVTHLRDNLAALRCRATCDSATCCEPNDTCETQSSVCGATGHVAVADKAKPCGNVESANTCSAALAPAGCCTDNPKCDTFNVAGCGAGRHRVDEASSKICQGAACKETECCQDNPTCSAAVCDLSLQWVLNKGKTDACSAQTCTEGECCVPLTCTDQSGAVCVGTREPNPETKDKVCSAPKCTEEECCKNKDRVTCGDQMAGDGAFCGKTQVFNPAKRSAACTGNTCTTGFCCTDSNNQQCGTAASICPATQQLRGDAGSRRCAKEKCTAADATLCCEDKALCSAKLDADAGFCATGQVAIENAASTHCSGTATGSCDAKTCCRPNNCGIANFNGCGAGTKLNKAAPCSAAACTLADCCTAFETCATATAAPKSLCDKGSGKKLANLPSACLAQSCTVGECCAPATAATTTAATTTLPSATIRVDGAASATITCETISAEQKAALAADLKKQCDRGCTVTLCGKSYQRRRARGAHARGGAAGTGRAVATAARALVGKSGHVHGSYFDGRRRRFIEVTITAKNASDPLDVVNGTLNIIEVDQKTNALKIADGAKVFAQPTTTQSPVYTTAPPTNKDAYLSSPNSKQKFMIGLRSPYVDRSGEGIGLTSSARDRKPIFDLTFNTGFKLDCSTAAGLASAATKACKAPGLQPSILVAMHGPDGICRAIVNRTDLFLAGGGFKCDDVDLTLMPLRYTKCNDAKSQDMAAAVGIELKSSFASGLDSLSVKKHRDAVIKFLDEEVRSKYPDFDIITSNENYKLAINEVIAIDGAVWGILTSLMLCFAAVVLFKANAVLVTVVSVVQHPLPSAPPKMWRKFAFACSRARATREHD